MTGRLCDLGQVAFVLRGELLEAYSRCRGFAFREFPGGRGPRLVECFYVVEGEPVDGLDLLLLEAQVLWGRRGVGGADRAPRGRSHRSSSENSGATAPTGAPRSSQRPAPSAFRPRPGYRAVR